MKEMRSEDPATIRKWDRLAIEEYGIPGIALMENAGAGAARIISGLSEKDCPPPFIILCGPGNNGGDGYVVARHLCNSGFEVEVCLCFAPESLDRTSDAGVNLGVIERMGIPTSCPGEAGPGQLLKRADGFTVIDALLGTGLSRPLEGPILAWVEALSQSEQPIISLDIPTGLDGRLGTILGNCAPASHTITFAAAKTGFFREQGPDITGRIHVVEIGLPANIREIAEKQQG
tara:strand:- start:1081 stop:1776 length:696 start_codon:yes stop_codon:yes gene_type:complete